MKSEEYLNNIIDAVKNVDKNLYEIDNIEYVKYNTYTGIEIKITYNKYRKWKNDCQIKPESIQKKENEDFTKQIIRNIIDKENEKLIKENIRKINRQFYYKINTQKKYYICTVYIRIEKRIYINKMYSVVLSNKIKYYKTNAIFELDYHVWKNGINGCLFIEECNNVLIDLILKTKRKELEKIIREI